MSDKPAIRATKLNFKGDSKKKKKRKHREDDDEGSSHRTKREEDNLPPEAWVTPAGEHEIRGPTFLYHPSDPPMCVSYDATYRKIKLVPLRHDEEAEAEAAGPSSKSQPEMLRYLPTTTAQVWVTTRVAGSTTINLRTGAADGKFLSCDAHGLVSADREARGPQEEWTPVILDGGMVALQNIYSKYLSVDEVAGGSLQLRGDSENIGFQERFWVKIQNRYRKEANEEERKRKGEDLGEKIGGEKETK
jgi:protein FRG1